MIRSCKAALIIVLQFTASLALAQLTGVKPSMIIVVGPPLSGKTEQAEMIYKQYGLPLISIDELLRQNAKELSRLQHPGTPLSDMRYDPAMARFFQKKMEATDRSRGVVVDAYPTTQYQAEALKGLLTSSISMVPMVLQIDVPDQVVQQRISAVTDPAKKTDAEQRLKDYHREFDAMAYYFPNANIVKIDGTKPAISVSKDIQAALDRVPIGRVSH